MINNSVVKRFYSAAEVSVYLGVSMPTAKKFCDRIGATVKIESRILYDVQKIDKYFAEQAAGES